MSDSRKQLKSPRKIPDDSDNSEREEEPSELNTKPMRRNPSTSMKPPTISPMRRNGDDVTSEQSGASPTRRGTGRQDSKKNLPEKSEKSSTRDKDRKNRSPDRADRNRSRKDGQDRDGKQNRDPSVSLPP